MYQAINNSIEPNSRNVIQKFKKNILVILFLIIQSLFDVMVHTQVRVY